MKQNFDLHVHTTTSDGSFSPTELVKKAKTEGILTIGIADHDTVGGVEEAIEAGKEFGINVIAGVEISIDFSPGTMHLCGYFIDIENEKLKQGLKFIQEGRINRNPQIIKKLNDLDMDITLEEVRKEAEGEVIGRPHISACLVKKGYVKDTKEAFKKFLAKGKPCYVERVRLKKQEAVNMIIEAGGVAVLAHPKQLKLNSKEEYKQLFTEFKEIGVLGIEAYSSHHSSEENERFKSLASELGMFVTGGSDFHGTTKPDVKLGVFGENVFIDIDDLLKRMKSLTAKERIS